MVSVVAAMVIGTIYYHPAVAGRAWMAAIGKTPEQIKADTKPTLYVITAVLALLQATVL